MRSLSVLFCLLGLSACATCGADLESSRVIIGPGDRPEILGGATTATVVLPADFDCAKGYKEYRIGPNRYRAYITQPTDLTVTEDAVRVVYAIKEGWMSKEHSMQGGCICDRRGGAMAPEIRGNLVSSREQYGFFQYLVPRRAQGVTINSASLHLYLCDSETSEPTTFEAWNAESVTLPGRGTAYAECCSTGGARPSCVQTPPTPYFTLTAPSSPATVVDIAPRWYTWDLTEIARNWASRAPYTGTLIIQGTSGVVGARRFSSSCNDMHPTLRPYLVVDYTAGHS